MGQLQKNHSRRQLEFRLEWTISSFIFQTLRKDLQTQNEFHQAPDQRHHQLL